MPDDYQMTCGGAALAEAGVPAAEAPGGGVFGAADAVMLLSL